MFTLIAITYRWMGNRALYAATFFISIWFLLAVLVRAMWMCLTRRVDWRRTSYSHAIDASVPLSRYPGRGPG